MEQAIRDFPTQFTFEPVIENEPALRRAKRTIVCGMGGSNLATGLVAMAHPRESFMAWRDYGLPMLPPGELEASLIIASSYSGETEETIHAFETALERGLALAAVATDGTLIQQAEAARVPFIRLPSTGIQPRASLGFQVRALLKLKGDEEGLMDTKKLSVLLNVDDAEERGKELARKLAGTVPVVYASTRNKTLAHIWKIKFNETVKIPAFCNTFPELNHNEMTGFFGGKKVGTLARPFHFIFLRDDRDSEKILRRMDETRSMLEDRGFSVDSVTLHGRERWHPIFDNLLVADWTALHLARHYGADPDAVPAVEEFKKRMA